MTSTEEVFAHLAAAMRDAAKSVRRFNWATSRDTRPAWRVRAERRIRAERNRRARRAARERLRMLAQS